MLVQAQHPAAERYAAAQLAREGRLERRRDHRHVERQGTRGEQVDQRDQPLVAPARVVVTEEHVHGSGRRVERGPDRPSQRLEPMGV